MDYKRLKEESSIYSSETNQYTRHEVGLMIQVTYEG